MKRSIIILLSFILLLTPYACFSDNNSVTPTPTPDIAAPPNTTPGISNGKTVVVDAGHGGKDGGAVGASTGVSEASINIQVALLLRNELVSRGYNVIMTRVDEAALAETKREDMHKRLEIMNADGVDVIVCVHMNKFSDASVSGPMAFYYKGSTEEEKLAKSIIDGVCDSIGKARRHANPGDYFLIRESTPPAVIVECGFLSNPQDETALQTTEYQMLIVKGIANGLDMYLFGSSE